MFARKPLLVFFAFALLLGEPRRTDASGLVAKPHVSPRILYGDEIQFDVYRAGEKVGFHQVRFESDGPHLLVDSVFEIEIDFLFFTAYRFAYRSRANWIDGALSRIAAEVDDDGTPFRLNATDDGNAFTIESTEGTSAANRPLFPTNHWNSAVLGQTQVLNTLTGRVNTVAITPIDRVPVETERGDVFATHYVYSGELDTEVWYDDEGRWVKMRFKARDGSTIEYVCQRCQGPDPSQAEQ